MARTITANTDSVTAVWHAVTNGKFILRIDSDISENWAQVLDDEGNQIGDAHRIYSDGWAVHTAPFGGYVNDSQVILLRPEFDRINHGPFAHPVSE